LGIFEAAGIRFFVSFIASLSSHAALQVVALLAGTQAAGRDPTDLAAAFRQNNRRQPVPFLPP
jgi:hypothetical protein